MLAYLENGTVDILAMPYYGATHRRVEHFGLSYPIFEKSQRYYVQRPRVSLLEAANQAFSLFSLDFYALTIAIVVAVALIHCTSQQLQGVTSKACHSQFNVR